MLTGEPHTII